jgi:hypothetical protein
VLLLSSSSSPEYFGFGSDLDKAATDMMGALAGAVREVMKVGYRDWCRAAVVVLVVDGQDYFIRPSAFCSAIADITCMLLSRAHTYHVFGNVTCAGSLLGLHDVTLAVTE